MGWYTDQIVPRFIDATLGGKRFAPLRGRAASGLSGDVVEIGFGSGLNVPHYPSSVRRVIAVDPSAVGKHLAAKRVAASAIPIEFAGLDGARLPFDDESADHVLSTWTLCTIPDVEGALGEVRRVLRPGGTFRFLEHGRSPDSRVARAHRIGSRHSTAGLAVVVTSTGRSSTSCGRAAWKSRRSTTSTCRAQSSWATCTKGSRRSGDARARRPPCGRRVDRARGGHSGRFACAAPRPSRPRDDEDRR